MPIYEYHCNQCDADFELLVRTADAEAQTKCPDCGGARVRRKLSLFGMSSASNTAGGRSSTSSCASCRASSCAGCHK